MHVIIGIRGVIVTTGIFLFESPIDVFDDGSDFFFTVGIEKFAMLPLCRFLGLQVLDRTVQAKIQIILDVADLNGECVMCALILIF